MNWFAAAGRSGAVRRFQARPVALDQLERVLDAAAQCPATPGLRGVVVRAEDASLPVQRAVFGRGAARRDAAPVAIVWYLEDHPAAGAPVSHVSPAVPGPSLSWPSPPDVVAAGAAIGFAVLAAAMEGLASAAAPSDRRLVRSALSLPAHATVVAVLFVGYPDTVSDSDSVPGARFFWHDPGTPFADALAGQPPTATAGTTGPTFGRTA